MFTRDYIITESEYSANVAKINAATDLLLENCADMDDVVYEGEGSPLTVLKNFIAKIAEQIAKFFKNIADKAKAKVDKAKNDKVIKAKIAEAKAAGVKTIDLPDIDRLKKIVDKSEKFIIQVKTQLEIQIRALDDADESKKSKAESNVVSLCKSFERQYKKITDEFEDAKDKKAKVSIDKVESLMKDGVDYIAEINKASDRMEKTIDEFKEYISEGMNSVPVKTAINKLADFMKEHGRMISCISAAYASVSVFDTAMNFKSDSEKYKRNADLTQSSRNNDDARDEAYFGAEAIDAKSRRNKNLAKGIAKTVAATGVSAAAAKYSK